MWVAVAAGAVLAILIVACTFYKTRKKDPFAAKADSYVEASEANDADVNVFELEGPGDVPRTSHMVVPDSYNERRIRQDTDITIFDPFPNTPLEDELLDPYSEHNG